MQDRMEHVGKSLLQHGPLSDRVYVMKVSGDDLPRLLSHVDALARREGYGKIFAKVPGPLAHAFIDGGYEQEAAVPGFFGGSTEGLFLARYLDPTRRRKVPFDELRESLNIALAKAMDDAVTELPTGLRIARLTEGDARACASVYERVFASYPFPIHDPAYICETMRTHVVYFGVFDGDELVAVSSSEMDREGGNVEMTDFATLPNHRGKSLATLLLHEMEKAMASMGMHCAFTIARALIPAMNITFSRMGYVFAGTLWNNTHIGGGLESMNVWYKSLRKKA